MKIKLSNAIFEIDDNCYDLIKDYIWHYDRGHGYISTRINGKKVYLHRFLLNAKKNEIVDHINRNKTDNRLINLRIASQSLNNHNKEKKGIYFDKYGNRWRACISLNNKTLKLGSFKTAKEAIVAYNRRATEIYGSNAIFSCLQG